MGSIRGNNSKVVLVFALLGLSFASYDLIIWFLGNAHSLLNVQVQDGYRFDEAYMYLAGIGKTILFDPYLKEHASSLTLRPMLPTAIFSGIYWICGRNLDLAIFVGHLAPPLISCYLIYRIALLLTGNKNLAMLAVLLAVGHFIFSALAIFAKVFNLPAGGIAGPDLYLLKQIFVHAGMLGNITAPNQFGRLFSPSLTLPFLLLPIPFILKQTRDGLRGVLIALNFFVYPHHVIVLALMELVAWIKNRKLPKISFFIAGMLTTIPYGLQPWIIHSAGAYQDIYGRVGQTSYLSSLWFFIPFFTLASAYIWHREKIFNSNLIFSLGCLISAIVIYLLDRFMNFPQVHLVGIRIFVFLAPLVLVCAIKFFDLPRLKYFNATLLALILFGYIHSGWVHRNEYSEFPANGFISALNRLPSGSVVMTDSQKEIAYISAASDKYSYLSYGIVSSATNQELIKRFVVVSRIYGWSMEKLHGGVWDGLMSTHHWIFHHGSNSKDLQNAAINRVVAELDPLTPCELLKLYQVDYIRFNGNYPNGLESCTKQVSSHFLKVEPKH